MSLRALRKLHSTGNSEPSELKQSDSSAESENEGDNIDKSKKAAVKNAFQLVSKIQIDNSDIKGCF